MTGKTETIHSFFPVHISLHPLVDQLFMYYRIFHYIALATRTNFNSYLSYVVTCSFFFSFLRLLRIWRDVIVENDVLFPSRARLLPYSTPHNLNFVRIRELLYRTKAFDKENFSIIYYNNVET